MGFSGGGSNVLKPHTHSAAILQDGGNLNFDNVTEANLTTGSITYSDGSALQELVKGTDGEMLELSGGFPSWQPGHSATSANRALSNLQSVAVNDTINMNSNIMTNIGAGEGYAKMETIANYETTTTENHTFTFSPAIDLDLYQYLYITVSGVCTVSADLELLWNGLTTGYNYNYSEDDNGTWTYTEATSQTQSILADNGLIGAGKRITARIWLLPHESNTPTEIYTITGVVDVEGEGRSLFYGARAPSDINNLTSLTIQMSTGGFYTHCRMRISGGLC
jgi:hypothetical protein